MCSAASSMSITRLQHDESGFPRPTRYLRWLPAGAEGKPADGSREVAGSDELELCARHLHDLEAAAPPVAKTSAARQASRWRALLDGSQRHLAREEHLGSMAGRRSMARAAWARDVSPEQRRVWTSRARSATRAFLESRRGAREAVLAGLQVPWCRVCHTVAQDTRRAAELLLAALRDGPSARRYQGSHGLCVQHLLDLVTDARAAAARAVLLGRLDVLAWELAEADRKQAWALRYQPAGPETGAWQRAAAMVDGAMFLGGRPHAWRTGSRVAMTATARRSRGQRWILWNGTDERDRTRQRQRAARRSLTRRRAGRVSATKAGPGRSHPCRHAAR
jgi:hypothetical protein